MTVPALVVNFSINPPHRIMARHAMLDMLHCFIAQGVAEDKKDEKRKRPYA
jgi:hypothetical protein